MCSRLTFSETAHESSGSFLLHHGAPLPGTQRSGASVYLGPTAPCTSTWVCLGLRCRMVLLPP